MNGYLGGEVEIIDGGCQMKVAEPSSEKKKFAGLGLQFEFLKMAIATSLLVCLGRSP